METAIVLLAALAAGAIAFWKALEPQKRERFLTLSRNARATASNVQQAIALKFDRRRAAYRALFLMPDGSLNPMGQIVFADLMQFGYVLSTTAAGANVTEAQIQRREGRRQMAIHIMSMLGASATTAHTAMQIEEHAVLG